MTTDKMRDLYADLAICNAATPGPWAADKGYEQSERGNYVYSQAEGSVVCAEQDGTDCVLSNEDARFIAEARTGWPHAIERALAAERKLAEIRRLAFNAKALGIKSAYIALDSILYEVGGHG